MKVYKKKFAHRNLLVFILLSVIYLLIVYAFSQGASFFSIVNLTSFLIHNSLVLLLLPFVFYSILVFKNYAKHLLFVFFAVIVGLSFVLLSASFNKLVLALNFAYVLLVFYFYTTWEIERGEAGYNPLFSSNDLEKYSRFPIQGIIYSKDRGNAKKVFLTNIDEHSCFVLLENDTLSMDKAVIEIAFDGVIFSSHVRPVSKYDLGMGFNFTDTATSPWSLSELCKICRDRGIFLIS
jgi:hypothetical protein